MMCTEADGSIYVRKMLKYGLLTFDLFEKKKIIIISVWFLRIRGFNN